MKKAKYIVITILLVLLAVIAVQNLENIKLKALFYTTELPTILVLSIAFVIGFLAGKIIRFRKREESVKKDDAVKKEQPK